MVTRPNHGLRQMFTFLAVLITIPLLAAGCFGRLQQSSEPSGSAPIATATPVAPTLPPGETATPGGAPTEPPTAPPTTEPTPNPHPDWPPGAIAVRDTPDHAGQQATVCGQVDTARWIFDVPGHPTWLNFSRPYPNMTFTALIWGEERRAWPVGGKPEEIYLGKAVCVSGLVEAYDGWYQIQNLTINDILVLP